MQSDWLLIFASHGLMCWRLWDCGEGSDDDDADDNDELGHEGQLS
jgi:hypothetical protein